MLVIKGKWLQVRVDQEMLDRLKDAAANDDRTVSQLIRRIVREWLDKQGK